MLSQESVTNFDLITVSEEPLARQTFDVLTENDFDTSEGCPS